MTDLLVEGGTITVGYPVGTEVEVRRRFDQAWSRGFSVVDQTPGGYRLRRESDGAILPVAFPHQDLRPAALR
jgi:hypothetical protein